MQTDYGAAPSHDDAPHDEVARDADARTEACAVFWLAAGGLLREHREARGWSQPDLARQAAVAHGTVARFELGEHRSPALADWRQVVAALGLDVVRCTDAIERRALRLLRADRVRHAVAPVGHSATEAAPPLAERSRRIQSALHAVANGLRARAAAGARSPLRAPADGRAPSAPSTPDEVMAMPSHELPGHPRRGPPGGGTGELTSVRSAASAGAVRTRAGRRTAWAGCAYSSGSASSG